MYRNRITLNFSENKEEFDCVNIVSGQTETFPIYSLNCITFDVIEDDKIDFESLKNWGNAPDVYGIKNYRELHDYLQKIDYDNSDDEKYAMGIIADFIIPNMEDE